MAFKIKSAKIFFGIKEHTVMLLSVVLSYFRQNCTATGSKQEEDKRLTSCQGHTAEVSCLSWLREGEAAEFSHRKTSVVRAAMLGRARPLCKL